MLFKNSTIGIASMLCFVVLVSHSRILDFLFETFLGRILLISMILFISYTHYILGIVSVLIMIIMFNNIDYGYGYGYMEGMENEQKPTTEATTATPSTTSSTASSTASSTTSSTASSISSSLAKAMDKAKDDVMGKIDVSTTDNTSSDNTSSDNISSDNISSDNTSSDNTSSADKPSSKKEKVAVEGFDLIGTENTIKRGKQSNSIPVYPNSNNGGNIAPYDGGSEYSAF